MLTIGELLHLPALAEARLCSAAASAEQEVAWVQTAALPPIPPPSQPNGLLLLPAPVATAETIAQLLATHTALLVESESLADGFATSPTALVCVPPGQFWPAATAVLELFAQRQQHLLTRANEVYEQLTELALRGGTLLQLAERLAALIGRSVMVEDATFRVLAAAVGEGEIDDGRRETMSLGRTSPQMAQYLLDAGIYRQMMQTLAPVQVPPLPAIGMTLPRVVVPIMVDREIYGYIWTIAGTPSERALETLATRHGATIAALIMFKERAVQEAEAALRGDFFEQLLNKISDKRTFEEQARRLNFHIERPHQILLIHGQARAGGSVHSLLRDVGVWLRQQGLDGLTAWREEAVVLVLEHKAGQGADLAQQAWQALSHPVRPLMVGVGQVVQETAAVRESYAQAWEAIEIGRALGRGDGIFVFEALGLLHWLYHLPPERLLGNHFLGQILRLATYDKTREAGLVETLEAYLDHGGSLVETAESLHIHRNTLIHRLKRITELATLDLRQPWQQLNLHLALKAYRLQQGVMDKGQGTRDE